MKPDFQTEIVQKRLESATSQKKVAFMVSDELNPSADDQIGVLSTAVVSSCEQADK